MIQPALRHIYVESKSDAGILRSALRGLEVAVDQFYPLDDRANVDGDAVRSLGLDVNVKGRLVCLAHQVDTWGEAAVGITCVVDADFDLLDFQLDLPSSLVVTDGGSMEVFAFREEPLQGWLDRFANVDEPARDVITRLRPLLNDLYFARAALHRLGVGSSLTDRWPNLLGGTRDSPSLDMNELLRRSMQGAGRAEIDRVVAEYERLKSLPFAQNDAIRGHDIAPLLAANLGLRGPVAAPDAVEGGLRALITPDVIRESAMFARLLGRLTRL